MTLPLKLAGLAHCFPLRSNIQWIFTWLIFSFLVVACSTPPPVPILAPSLIEGQTSVSGSGVPKATVEILVDGKPVAKGPVAEGGDFALEVAPLAVDQVVTVTQSVKGLTSGPSSPVTVQKTVLAKIEIHPGPSITLLQGRTETFSAVGIFSNGRTEDPLSGVTWINDNPNVATVDLQGRVTAMKAGSTSIWANRGYLQSSKTTVMVRPRPPRVNESLKAGDQEVRGEAEPFASIQVSVNGVPRGSSVQAGAQGEWQASELPSLKADDRVTSIQTVDQIQSDPSTTVTVGQAVLMDIVIRPAPSVTAEQGEALRFTARGTYSNGKVEDPLSGVVWTTENPSIATIDSGGVATGVTAGTVSITASLHAIQSETTMLTIEPIPPIITSRPRGGDTSIAGTAHPLAEIQVFVNGVAHEAKVEANAQGRWEIRDLAALTENDQVTSTQTVNSVQSTPSALVVVSPAVLTHIQIQPDHVVTVKHGPPQRLTAIGNYSDGKVERSLAGVTWLTAEPQVATVDFDGFVSGIDIGTTTIQASRGDIQSPNLTVTVKPIPPIITSSLRAGDTTVSGTAEPSARIQVFLNDATIGGQVVADSQGHWQIRDLPSLKSDGRVSSIQTINDLQSEPSRVVQVLSNHPPAIGSMKKQSVRLGNTLSVTITATDPDSDELTFEMIRPPKLANSTLDPTSGLLTFTPVSDQVGETTLTFQVSDGYLTGEGTVTIDVTLPDSLVVLLDNPDGTVGMIDVTNAGETQVLDQATQAVRLESPTAPPTKPFLLREEIIQKVFKETLEAKPEDPLKFVLYFEVDTTELVPQSLQQFPEILSMISQRAVPDIGVIGHTDRTASEEYNIQLSLRRANAIRDLIISRGIDPDAVEVTAHGENNPLVETPDNVSEPLNRRVEIIVR